MAKGSSFGSVSVLESFSDACDWDHMWWWTSRVFRVAHISRVVDLWSFVYTQWRSLYMQFSSTTHIPMHILKFSMYLQYCNTCTSTWRKPWRYNCIRRHMYVLKFRFYGSMIQHDTLIGVEERNKVVLIASVVSWLACQSQRRLHCRQARLSTKRACG